MSANVLLLRSPSDDGTGVDKYEDAFRTRGYRAVSIPVLETVHMNLAQLTDIIRSNGKSKRYAGVVVTSGRSCETWRASVHQLEGGQAEMQQETVADLELTGWSSIPFYAVGEATASALAAIRHDFPSSPYVPHNVRGSGEAGTGEKLAHFIVADLADKDITLPLLYLTGDKNKETLPDILKDADLALESLQVYATQGSSRFEHDLWSALDGVQALGEERWWIVYFAPSSAKHVSPIFSRYLAVRSGSEGTSSTIRRTHIAAIGPTTASLLLSELDILIHVVAEKPTPEALAEGIARWDRENQ